MLKLTDIKKDYLAGENQVHALKGVSLSFREQEFVSILGPSGCGKTTLLNIIGGLDHYTSGDLVINGVSTKQYKDHDWDTYRNHSIGFVFQSYNLIPHQTVLANVELALTLSGVSKSERKQRAIDVLTKVGLGDQINKKPNQLSGGQMQRVAIARALINNPDILLADEPTGALDTETSVQIMELLKEVAKDKLVIMVTHNPELAVQYSSRIIKLLDGKIIDDSDPFDAPDKVEEDDKGLKKAKTSMGFFTALALSLTNLMTKKGRTFLTAFAGSIGIIGIALILSLSNGIQLYIDSVEEDTLSAYPITIQQEVVDMTNVMETMMGMSDKPDHPNDKVYSKNVVAQAIKTMVAEAKSNNLRDFKVYLDESQEIQNVVNDIQYSYNINPIIYLNNKDNVLQVNPFDISGSGMQVSSGSMNSMYSNFSSRTWSEMLSNESLLHEQYEVVEGSWPTGANECVLVVDNYNQITDMTLYALGLKDSADLYKLFFEALNNIGDKEVADKFDEKETAYEYNEILGLTYKLILPSERYSYNKLTNTYDDLSKDKEHMACILDNSYEIKLVGIIKKKEGAVAATMQPGTIGYTHALTEYYINEIQKTDLVKAQLENENIDILTGLPFDSEDGSDLAAAEKKTAFLKYVDSLSSLEKANLFLKVYSTPSDEEIAKIVQSYMEQYPTRADKEEAIIKQLIETIRAINAGEIGPEILMAQGMDEATIAQLSALTDTDITVMLKQTYSQLDEAQLNDFFQTAVTQMVQSSFTGDMAEKFNNYSNDELGSMFDEYLKTLSDDDFARLYDSNKSNMVSKSSYKDNLTKFGLCYLEEPHQINIFAKSFEDKEELMRLIDEYNDNASEENKITYTDYVGLMMSSVTNIVDIISYVLIAFVSISLVVSSIMIGIITYISVLERTKEIGILRAIGASKKDIRHVFNSEALTIGFVSGAIGIIVTLLLNIPINIIIKHLTGVGGIAQLPWLGGLILVLISMFLTFIAGLIPSSVAAKKDPVIALRSE